MLLAPLFLFFRIVVMEVVGVCVNAPAGFVALLLVQDAFASCRTGVRTYTPDDANKKPQLKAGVLLFGAPGEIRTPDQVVRSHLLYPAELRVLEVL